VLLYPGQQFGLSASFHSFLAFLCPVSYVVPNTLTPFSSWTRRLIEQTGFDMMAACVDLLEFSPGQEGSQTDDPLALSAGAMAIRLYLKAINTSSSNHRSNRDLLTESSTTGTASLF
jgi:hypothetical protein